MLHKLLKSTDIRQLTSLVSPAFFDVMPMTKIWSRGRALMTTRGGRTYREAVERRVDELAKVPLSIQLLKSGTLPVADAWGGGSEGRAARLVTLYFHQLFSDAPTLLDLRATSCREEGETLVWDPAPWVCAWDGAFLHDLRRLYRGFYEGDDAMFRDSLQALRIDLAEDLFRQHFGAEQSGQEFKMRDFVDTFHQVFVRCRDRKVELHPDFLALGVYLATLYEHLDGQKVRVDVRACYTRAYERRPSALTARSTEQVVQHG